MRLMRRWPVVLAGGVLLTATVAACGEEKAAQPDGALAFAYQDRDGFAVLNGERQVARIGGTFAGPLVWTTDAKYAGMVAIDWDSEGSGKVVSVEVATGKQRELACGCLGFAGIGGARIAWANDDGKLFTADLSTDNPPDSLEARLPSGFQAETVVAGTDGLIMVHTLPRNDDPDATSPDEQRGSVYVVPVTGEPVLASGFDPVQDVRPVAVSGRRFAYGVIRSQGDCAHWGPINIFDQAAASITGTDSAAVLRIGPADSEVAVDDLWWAADGSLHASLSVVTCDPEGGKIAVPASRWRLDGTVWVGVDEPSVVRERPVRGGGRLTLDGDGALRLITASGSRDVATGVQSISAPPARPA